MTADAKPSNYFRAIDPFPLESSDHNKLHEFYARLAEGRLSTTACTGCGATAWPPRGFCPECGADGFRWVDLPPEAIIHAFTVQETGLPSGFPGPRVFAIVKVGDHRVFTVVLGAEASVVRIGQRVRFSPVRIADDPRGNARWLPAFTTV